MHYFLYLRIIKKLITLRNITHAHIATTHWPGNVASPYGFLLKRTYCGKTHFAVLVHIDSCICCDRRTNSEVRPQVSYFTCVLFRKIRASTSCLDLTHLSMSQGELSTPEDLHSQLEKLELKREYSWGKCSLIGWLKRGVGSAAV